MTETHTFIDRLINSGFFESAIEHLENPKKNFALLGPEGSGLEELLDRVYTQETRNDMLKKGYLVTSVNVFTSPETPADVFRNLCRDVRDSLNTVLDNGVEEEVLREIACGIPSDNDLNAHNFDAVQSDFTNLVTKLKEAGYQTVFVYSTFENLVFPAQESVENELNEIYALLRKLSDTCRIISFVVTTPYGLVFPNPLIRSDFLDSFRPFWTVPKLTSEQIRALIEPILQKDWPNDAETICEDIRLWTFGNPKLISYFVSSLNDSGGDLGAMSNYWCDSKSTGKKKHVYNMMERWCSYFERIEGWKLRDTLHAIATGETVSGRKGEVKYLEEIGLISYDSNQFVYTCCDVLALYVDDTHTDGSPI